MRKLILVLSLAILLMFALTGVAFAVNSHLPSGDRKMEIKSDNCAECHAGGTLHTSGPHGGYSSTTDKCQSCHDIHGSAENSVLLMGTNLTAACQYCHDLTATWAGPYNMTGVVSVKSAHRVVGVDVYSYKDSEGHMNDSLTTGITTIPGGNWYDGSEGTLNTAEQGQLSGNVFTCNSCHTPHGVQTVNNYLGESEIKHYEDFSGNQYLYMTNRLLKQRPNVSSSVYMEYNGSWCASCHMGRDNRIVKHSNHPVNTFTHNSNDKYSALNDAGKPYFPAYQFLAIAKEKGWLTTSIASAVSDNKIQISGSGAEATRDLRANTQYRLTDKDFGNNEDPRDDADGYAEDDVSTSDSPYEYGPACQQCHGSARDVDTLFGALTNPARGSFPHVSVNKALLVEEGDDFCTNCHNPGALP